ncbi:hypothetical protein L1987_11165 [Smallanthus sonchifolius]|uniref:Uncharacterized protein n=1 Tax=Smallanthus sonchifolius TaxID=185202 RepID=A0ACB9JCA1_9ASTR|nr:hypothetical protein L1987_11165 [Smallanthus sonchifolius]
MNPSEILIYLKDRKESLISLGEFPSSYRSSNPKGWHLGSGILVLVKVNKTLMSETNDGNPMPSKEQEEAVIKKKYGGLLPKKNPLISKDHDRAFFDSADWALGKQGSQKSKGPLEALRPKLQPTPQQQSRSRRSAYAPAGEGEVDSSNGDMENDEKDLSKD